VAEVQDEDDEQNIYVLYFKLVCIIILIIMYSICFLKFIVRKMNSEMVKSGMVVLTEREKVDTDEL
jgi:hypothetical protein